MFLEEPPPSEERDAAYAEDVEEDGFVWTLTKLWAWNSAIEDRLRALLDEASDAGGLSFRDRGMLVSATATTIRNSSCALAWGNRLASSAGVDTAVGVLTGGETESMSKRDRVLSRWARKVAGDPTSTTGADIADLRALGLTDAEIHAITVYIGARIAFSTVNDALGAPLDRPLLEEYPPEVVEAVNFGRPSS